ncbi:MAG TPA: hypothetical protein VMU92_04350 [Acidobacteriaceae bacterium]|nr:hypothetical protein [Acidobacteriaceae bacterium]
MGAIVKATGANPMLLRIDRREMGSFLLPGIIPWVRKAYRRPAESRHSGKRIARERRSKSNGDSGWGGSFEDFSGNLGCVEINLQLLVDKKSMAVILLQRSQCNRLLSGRNLYFWPWTVQGGGSG